MSSLITGLKRRETTIEMRMRSTGWTYIHRISYTKHQTPYNIREKCIYCHKKNSSQHLRNTDDDSIQTSSDNHRIHQSLHDFVRPFRNADDGQFETKKTWVGNETMNTWFLRSCFCCVLSLFCIYIRHCSFFLVVSWLLIFILNFPYPVMRRDFHCC